MSLSATESDAVTASLRTLSAREGEVAAPYDFTEFQRRASRPAPPSRGFERSLRIAATIAPLALLLTIAGVERHGVSSDDAVVASDVPQPRTEEPALVHVGAAARVNDLEDRIAWLDTMITEAPVTGLSVADRAELTSGREALANSLQRVRYAQTLLAY